MKKRLLITGASGFLGAHLCKEASKEFEVAGVYHSNPIPVDVDHALKLDLTDFDKVGDAITNFKPDFILHTAAITSTALCKQQPEQSNQLNFVFVDYLSDLCNAINTSLLFTSTDLVFDGRKGNYSEDGQVNPISDYGIQKVHAENAIKHNLENYWIARMPLMLGEAFNSNASYLQDVENQYKSGKTLNLFEDELRTPSGVKNAARAILHLLNCASGVYHLGGMDVYSRFDLGRKIFEVNGWNPVQIERTKQAEIDFDVPRPANVTLNIKKLLNTGFKPESIAKELKFNA